MKVETLFELCLDVVANNICLAESFVGFPDVVGKQIFDKVVAANKFSLENITESQQALFLFASAYEEDVLSSVNLEGRHLVLADCMEHLMLFCNLRALNLSACGLGDDPDLLYHISKLERLEVLDLRDNALTDEGIRKLTIPIRVNKTGPMGLKVLDLSENEDISTRCLKFLKVFGKLQLLDLSATSAQSKNTHNLQELGEFVKGVSLMVIRALPVQQHSDLMQMKEVKTVGWAAGIIQSWIHWSWARQERHKAKETLLGDSPKRCRFYGKRGRSILSPTKSPSPAIKRAKGLGDSSTSSMESLLLVHSSLLPEGTVDEFQKELSTSTNQFGCAPYSVPGGHIRRLQFGAFPSSEGSGSSVSSSDHRLQHCEGSVLNNGKNDNVGYPLSGGLLAALDSGEETRNSDTSNRGEGMSEEELMLLSQYGCSLYR